MRSPCKHSRGSRRPNGPVKAEVLGQRAAARVSCMLAKVYRLVFGMPDGMPVKWCSAYFRPDRPAGDLDISAKRSIFAINQEDWHLVSGVSSPSAGRRAKASWGALRCGIGVADSELATRTFPTEAGFRARGPIRFEGANRNLKSRAAPEPTMPGKSELSATARSGGQMELADLQEAVGRPRGYHVGKMPYFSTCAARPRVCSRSSLSASSASRASSASMICWCSAIERSAR